MSQRIIAAGAAMILTAACGGGARGAAAAAAQRPADAGSGGGAPMAATSAPGSFGEDVAFLKQHTPVVILRSADGQAQVAVAPGYQGRVMTSTAAGDGGTSYGFLHRSIIAEEKRQPHMTVLGGEDRFWLGPEGGQYGLYFPPGSAFDADHWQVPEPIDWGAWKVAGQSDREITFEQPMSVTNYSGTTFSLTVERIVRLLDPSSVAAMVGDPVPAGVRVVAFESENHIRNTGTKPWEKASGLVSIWILGQYQPGPHATIVLPYTAGSEKSLGPVVNDKYFGPIPPDRLHIGDDAVFYRGDGKARGKIGLPRARARGVAGAFDPDRHVLTIIQFTMPPDARDYVNSMWEHQAKPYDGDAVNSYNDGPIAPGQPPMGPFYEVESSSPGAALAPGGTMAHVHRTVHIEGPDEALDTIAQRVLGVTLKQITESLP